MKIVNISGGLGNQMFCYAFALALKEISLKEELYIDISHFKNYHLHNGYELNQIFSIDELPIASKKEIRKISYYIPHYKLSRFVRRFFPKRKNEYVEKKDYVFDDQVFKIRDSCYYEGYWQSPQYFDVIRKKILETFTFKNVTPECISIANEMSIDNSVGIHVRRGDYLNAKSFKGICDLSYYRRAIENVFLQSSNPKFYIFSNDIEWCKENLNIFLKNRPVKYIDFNLGNKSSLDMYLMTKCKFLIVANSSFSWWGAYLNQTEDLKVISPKKWVNRNYETEIHLSTWKKI